MSARKLDDKNIRADALIANFEAQAELNSIKSGHIRNRGPVDARDLTDDELRILNRSFNEAMTETKNHPWFSGKTEPTPYWKQKIKVSN